MLCLPARDDADEIVALMLCQCLQLRGYTAQTVRVAALASEMARTARQHDAWIVAICSLPPATIYHARHLCKHLRQQFPDLAMVVGLWNVNSDLASAKSRIGRDESIHVVATLCEMLQQIDQLSQYAPKAQPAESDVPNQIVGRVTKDQ